MLVVTLPFSVDALRWAFDRYLPGRPASFEDIAGEPTLPLLANARQIQDEELAGRASRVRVFGSDWLVMEAVPVDMLLPRASWTAGRYLAALTALADLHATWWGQPPDPAAHPWVWQALGHDAALLVEEARAALLRIEAAPWGSRFFTPEQIRGFLRALDEPACLLDILTQMPHTLLGVRSEVAGRGERLEVETHRYASVRGAWPGTNRSGSNPPPLTVRVGVGPAPYDLACLYSWSRWWFGRVPLSLTAMRNHYLQRLNERLGRHLDRYLFDAAFDAARAWNFLTLWPAAILDRHASLLANRHHLQATVLEPAYAALRRCMR